MTGEETNRGFPDSMGNMFMFYVFGRLLLPFVHTLISGISYPDLMSSR